MSSSVISLAERKVAQQSVHLTLGILAKISGSFLRLSIFLAGRLRRPRPSAGVVYIPAISFPS